MRFLAALAFLTAIACGSVTPAPAGGTPLTAAQLKFAVMDAVGKPSYCDPDFWPVARTEMPNAIAQHAAIRADSVTYAAILEHEHLPAGDLTDSEKLAVYRAWKLLRAVPLTTEGAGYSFQYRVRTGDLTYELVAGDVDGDGRVTVISRTSTGAPNCPICLASSTLIATPGGPIRVTEVRVGTVVWTRSPEGARVAAPVVEVGSMPAPPGHLMVDLVLANGREVLVSPGHRAADRRPVGALLVGDHVDGSVVMRAGLVPYAGGRTYDILPAGATGVYWANGILLESTLR